MKNSFTLTASLLLGAGSLMAQLQTLPNGVESGGQKFTYPVSGQFKDLELCTYEICRRNSKGKLEILPIAAGSTSALLAKASTPDSDDYLVFYPKDKRRNPDARLIMRHRYLIKVADGADLSQIQARCGIKSLQAVRPGSNLVICTEESSGKVLSQLSMVANDHEVEAVEPLFAKKRPKRIVPSDPLYDFEGRPDEFTVPFAAGPDAYQWYLNNEGANGGLAGIDIRFQEASNNATGNGITVGIIDDGIAVDHEDLMANITGPHLNIVDGGAEPGTTNENLTHGTNVAGILAAAANNDFGISGAAPDAGLSSIVLLGDAFDDADEGAALGFEPTQIDIYNSSYGPDDTVFDLDGPGTLAADALLNGVMNGRVVGDNALGNIYVWAAGNGGIIGDNSNFDGYANSPFTIAVGAVSDNGIKARFSEKGANLVVSAPSGGGAQNMVTTSFTVFTDEDGITARAADYVDDFSGTSAATPLVSATVAMMLEENSDLTWRDVQDILIRSARKIDQNSGGWNTNGAGLHFNHSYGAGLVDADVAVRMAGGNPENPWEPLGPVTSQVRAKLFFDDPNDPEAESGEVPDNNGASFLSEYDFSINADGSAAENLKVEHVELQARILTQSRSDLEIVVISPSGTQSIMQESDFENEEGSINNWKFMTTHNWGEGSAGTWLIRVTDRTTGNPARVNNARLIIHGSPDENAPVGSGPLLTSSRNVFGDQGRAFNYDFLTTEGVTDIQVGDLPSGLDFDPTRLVIFGTPDTPGLYQIPVTLTNADGEVGMTGISFIIRPTSVALGDAVGLAGIPAVFDGDLPFDFEFGDTNDPVGTPEEERQSATSSVNLEDNQESVFGFNGLGRGVLIFDWKVSSEEGFDRLWFNLGGDVPQDWSAFISGEKDWGRAAVLMPDPSNDVRWIYTKDGTISEGEDRGLIDNVETMSIEKYRDEVARAANITGFDFELSSRALFIPTEANGASPPDDGGAPSALISPSIGNGQSTSLAGWVEGPGQFNFLAINFAEQADVFEFLLDGVVLVSGPGLGAEGGAPSFITGSGDPLAPGPRLIPEGRHRVELRFRKNFRGSDAATFEGSVFDGVLLDNVSFVPDSDSGEVRAYPSDIDTDLDGYNDHLENAFGGNPDVSDVPPYLPQVVTSGDQSYIEYGIDTSKTYLNYIPQQSSDLENWFDASLQSLVRVEGSVEVYRIPIVTASGRRNLFYRVIAKDRFAR